MVGVGQGLFEKPGLEVISDLKVIRSDPSADLSHPASDPSGEKESEWSWV